MSEKAKKSRLDGFPYYLVAAISALAILICINQLFHLTLFGFMPIGNAYYYYILSCYLSITYLIFPASKRDLTRIPAYDWALFFVCMATTIYLGINGYNILTFGWEYSAPTLPTIAGCVLWGLALEGTRRAGGTSIFVIALAFSVYPMFADKMPGFLWGTPFSPLETARYHAMGVDSIIGIPIKVAGNILLGFIIFGVALVSTGGSRFFMDLAMSLMGSRRGGAAKVSVLSSSLMASLSGSVISNVVTTGAVTIPTMKKTGYTPTYAAAIEACASTGGTIMPPIMGAAGFLIASFLNVPYVKVIYAAFFPAFLYYFTLLIQVDAHAASKDIQGLKKSEIPSLFETIKSGWFYIGALILLIFFLVYIRIEAWAPFFTILFLFTCAMLRKETRFDVPKAIEFLVETARLVGQIVAICAGVGLIIGSLSGTGVANSFSREIVILAGGNAALLLVFGAFASFVLGIGMTVTACYVFLAIVLVPALVKIGFNEMACHLFVLYWSCLSYITPPVALGSITAAAIAGSDNIKTGLLSMRLGSAKYIVPFLFVVSPTMILSGQPGRVILSVVTAVLGCLMLGNALEGYLYFVGKIHRTLRALVLVSGLMLLYPDFRFDLMGACLAILVFLGIKFGMFNKGKLSRTNQDEAKQI